jgi:hypothetical protein
MPCRNMIAVSRRLSAYQLPLVKRLVSPIDSYKGAECHSISDARTTTAQPEPEPQSEPLRWADIAKYYVFKDPPYWRGA